MGRSLTWYERPSHPLAGPHYQDTMDSSTVARFLIACAVIALIWTGYYLWHCWRFPDWPCRKCKGAGKLSPRRRWRKATRPCTTCKTTGRRARRGARLLGIRTK